MATHAAKRRMTAKGPREPGESPTKRAALPPPALVSHPTLCYIQERILQPLEEELSVLAAPLPFGGIAEFSAAAFAENLKRCKEYECNVAVSSHRLGSFEHPRAIPSVGAIERIMRQCFWNKDGDEPQAHPFTHAICVRAISTEDSSTPWEPVANAAYLIAFLLAWSIAKERRLNTEPFSMTARMVRTRFFYLPDVDAFERKKWGLQETASELSEQTSLYGFKRILVVVHIQQMLNARSLKCDATSIAAWFREVQFASSSESITAKTASTYLKIYNRFSDVPAIEELLETLDSVYGRRHTLSNTSVLDTLCQRTSIPTNRELSTRVLAWVAEGIAVLHVRGTLRPDAGRDSVRDRVVPALLLKRRVVVYMAGKFRFNNGDRAFAPGRAPGEVLREVFGTYRAFHTAYPKGYKLDGIGAGAGQGLLAARTFRLAPQSGMFVFESQAYILTSSCECELVELPSSPRGFKTTAHGLTLFAHVAFPAPFFLSFPRSPRHFPSMRQHPTPSVRQHSAIFPPTGWHARGADLRSPHVLLVLRLTYGRQGADLRSPHLLLCASADLWSPGC
jgi:hypothetical protein